MIKYMRPSGNPIELADTPNMAKFAEQNGFTRIIKSSSKESSEDVEIPKFTKKNKRKG